MAPKDPIDLFFDHIGDYINRSVYRGPDDELPAAIYDTFQELWKKSPRKPLLTAKTEIKSLAQMEEIEKLIKDGIEEFPEADKPKKKDEEKEPLRKRLDLPKRLTPQGILKWINCRPKKKATWYFVIHLPGEISYQEFLSKQSNFETAVGGWVEISKIGAAVYMKASNVLLKRVIPYCFDPSDYPKMELPILVGYDAQGPVVLDLAEAISILIAGFRNYGKSVLIADIIYSLLLQNKDVLYPKVHIVIVDTEVAEFDYFEPYGPLWVNNHLDALKCFELLNGEAQRRKKLIMPVANNLTDYRKLGHKDIPYIVVILDELKGLGMFYEYIDKILREFRKWGICVIAATQRPSMTMWDKFKRGAWMDVKSQFEVRIGLKMADETNARMIFDSPRCAHLPSKVPGRAIIFWDEEREIQVPYFPKKVNKKALQELLSKLQPVPMPYENVEGEVYEYEPKYPQTRGEERQKSSGPSRTKLLLNSGTNPFT